MALVHFLAWTLMLYWIHRIGHQIPAIRKIHLGHHRFIATNPPPQWHWSNLFLFQDDWPSTVDVWVTEIIPTLIFCWITGAWWIAVFFYLWSALIQESIEHSPMFDRYPWFTSGRWHLMHHSNGKCNYGIFITVWDRLFGTFKYHK